MRNNGMRIALVIFFLVLTGWKLIPSVRYYFLDRKLDAMTEDERAAYLAEGENYERYQNLRDGALNLGLDLQGGMHVTMEVQVGELVRALATDTDAPFEAAMRTAQQATATSDDSFVDLFVNAFEAQDPNARLSRYFRSEVSGISRRASNAEVRAYLLQEAEEAVNRAIEIVRQRVDRFGVTEPSIVKQGTRRIVVELPGVDDPERVRRLLRGTARLDFRLMADPQALQRSVSQIIAYYDRNETREADSAGAAVPADSAAADAAVGDTSLSLTDLTASQDQIDNPILRYLDVYPQPTVEFGVVAIRDTAALNAALFRPEVLALLPAGVELMYEAKPLETDPSRIRLLGVRTTAELTGEVITDASVDFDETNQAQVIMVMNGEGARTWARVTGANIGKQIAITLDGLVYSFPNVLGRITGGRSSITGVNRAEANDIVTILKSGALPAPVSIIEERTVGPSLGAESIQAGLNSLLLGFTLVVIFMIVYYRTAGILADVALLVNVIFILGILSAFGATLTLPGMAGIVLTIGMAVDANVLIFERVREELRHGRTLRAAIEAGYNKAFSAIFDANITTFFTGLILYSFGVGPIKGFAVTLMAGIAASLFSAIVITRLLFDWLVEDRKMLVSIG